MKLTRQQEAEISEIYEAFWGALLYADIEIYSLLLDENFRLIGTTDAEFFSNKREAVKFLKDTAEQLAGNIDRRNSKIRIESIEGFFLITERFDAYALIEDNWSFYARTRVSTWMRKQAQGWKLVQQHFSFPDAKAEEGETVGLEKISKVNMELKEAIKRRTFELEHKTKELEIESALERVRAVAMGMKIPHDLLGICEIVFNELKALGFDQLRNTLIHTFNDQQLYFDDYDFSSFTGGYVSKIPYKGHPAIEQFIKDMRKDQTGFSELKISGKKLTDWKKFRKVNNEADDPRLDDIKALYYYIYSVAGGGIGISTFRAISEHELTILKRFRNVFDLAYKRYVDIKLAEAQATEAQIQLALERVRARTMAMQQSEEITEVVKMLYQEFDKLKINNESTDIEIGLIDEETGIASIWAHFYLSDGTISTFKFPLTHFKELAKEFKVWKNTAVEKRNEIFTTSVFSEKQWTRFMKVGEELPELAEIFRPLMDAKITKWVTHNAYFSHGMLTLQGTEAYSQETQEIQKRFTRVFEQTYIRFLDLQKAEAQAREAQIELALERVRARTMAMQKSDELEEVIRVVYDQFVQLKIHIEHTGFILDYKERDDMLIWLADQHGVPSPQVSIPYFDSPHWNSFVEAKKKGAHFFSNQLDFKAKNKFYRQLFKLIPGIPKETLNFYLGCPALAISTVLLDNVGLYIENFEGIIYTDEENDVLMRIGKVFQQTYTRFLDLQKAEAQAREAEIQLALERVRARSLAMHTSEELSQVMSVMYRQLEDLQINNVSCELILCDDDRDVLQYWSATVIQTTIPEPFNIPRSLDPFFEKQWQAWKKGEDRLVIIVEGKEKKAYDKLLLEKSEFRNFPLEIQELIRSRKKDVFTHACLKYGLLESVGDEPLSDTDFQILKRFAKVFDQTYTRFLDLQKAEAQAREAQIEAALERVRSRTMAMHKTDELLEAAELVGRELSALGVTSMNVSYAFVDEDEKHAAYYSVNPVDGKIISFPFVFPHTETKVMRSILSSWKKQDPFTMIELDEQATLKHQTWVGGQIQNLIIKNNSGIPFSIEAFLAVSPKKAVIYTFNFKQGYLFKIGGERLTTAQEELVLRFTKVFEMTYRRFLDLKQAEQQTREAQVELGLERVRARAMAMQNSDELKELIGTVFIELTKLDLVLTRCLIMIYDTQTNGSTWWMANSEAPAEPISLYVKNHQLPPYAAYIKAWKERKNKWQYLLEGKNKNSWDDFLFAETELSQLPEFVIAGMKAPDRVCLSASFNNFGCLNLATLEPLSGEHFDLLLRFAKVFDLTYTRFNDLQKAEAQAREAKIELGLERVRARAMAMQKSDELSELVDTVLKELTKLDFALNWCIINIIDEPSLTNMVWAANPETNKPPESYLMKFEDYPFHHSMLNGYRERKTKHVYVIEGEEKTTYDNYLFNETEWRRVPKAAQDASRAMKRYVATFTFSNFGGLQTVGEEYLSEQNLDILSRFGKVFDLTYTRFNDLQKAEVQARESQIEAALERVRSQTMGMQKSEDLSKVATAMFDQIRLLGGDLFSCGIVLCNENKDEVDQWLSAPGFGMMPPFFVPKNLDDIHQYRYDQWKAGTKLFSIEIPEDKIVRHFELLFALPSLKNILDAAVANGIPLPEIPKWEIDYGASFNYGYLLISSLRPFEEAQIFPRFAKVFDQTYTRFLDLKKAEAQAREAQIETGLERVRSRTMAMHKSKELTEVSALLYKELQILGVTQFLNCGYVEIDEVNHIQNAWMTNADGLGVNVVQLPLKGDPVFDERYGAWKRKVKLIHQVVGGDLLKNHIELGTQHYRKTEIDELVRTRFPDPTIFYCGNFNYGYLNIITGTLLTEEQESLLTRFTKVFEMTYGRFLDLQKAEAQAREAQIEAALEKVRSRSLAMQKPDELQEVVSVVAEKLKELGVILDANGVIICTYFPDSKDVMHWISAPDFSSSGSYLLPYFDHPIFSAAWESKNNGDEYFSRSFTKDEKDSFFKYAFENSDYRNFPDEFKQWIFQNDKHSLSFAWAKNSALLLPSHTGIVPSESDKEILKRFARVFEQAYIRFMDLKNAEALTHKSKIEVALERVRARALAMQEPEELKAVAEVLRFEMGILGVEELETCSIYINDEKAEQAECWYALKDLRSEEKILVNDHFALNLNDTWVGREMLKFYQSAEKQTSIVMTGQNRLEWIRMCEELSAPFRGYYGEVIPDRTYHLYKFSHGAIGAAAAGDISEESWELLRRAASVFSLAYSRFKDLTQARIDLEKLKTEKQRAEDALTHLKAAQSQLVQSEKMASLGELTAGIAHEIQNPLNFVNNFSEVSNELLDEMMEEAAKGNFEEVKEILNDVKQNLEKINHHGKRADGIVKGMLQHSRSSSGSKVLTNINALADEYLRLAFHGLRAKDKNFNATLVTDFDENLGAVNIIPQDIGRVILNLITNAFYTVDARKKQMPDYYQPSVSVATKNKGDNVELRVVDNGNGIPPGIIDKIFQPFFTTKPTGQGTGLGLSLAYDIITAHGGELKVETKEGEGSAFIISIPFTN